MSKRSAFTLAGVAFTAGIILVVILTSLRWRMTEVNLGGLLGGLKLERESEPTMSDSRIAVSTSEPQYTSQDKLSTSESETPDSGEITSPLREQHEAAIGSGPLMKVYFSDGLAQYTDEDLTVYHYRIQRIRPEENPDGCAVALYNTDRIWFGSAEPTSITVNGSLIADLSVVTGKHGYVLEWPLKVGDRICVTNISTYGFQFVFGPDMYYHYDSYCYRNHCE